MYYSVFITNLIIHRAILHVINFKVSIEFGAFVVSSLRMMIMLYLLDYHSS